MFKHEWLVAHGLIKSDYEKKRDAVVEKMQYYYYTPQEHVYDSWSDSELRQWLIDHNVIKSDAQVKKDKMRKLVAYVFMISYIEPFLIVHSETITRRRQTLSGLAGLIAISALGFLHTVIFVLMRKRSATNL